MILFISLIVIALIIKFVLKVKNELNNTSQTQESSELNPNCLKRIPELMYISTLVQISSHMFPEENSGREDFYTYRGKEADIGGIAAFVICFVDNMMLRHKFDHGFIDLTNSIFMGEYMNELISEEEVNATLTRSAKIRDTYQQVLEHAKNDTLSHGVFKTGEFYLNYIFNLNLEDVLFQFRDENSIKELPNMEEAFRGYTSFVAFLKALEKPFEEIINSNDFKIRYKSINFREIQKFY